MNYSTTVCIEITEQQSINIAKALCLPVFIYDIYIYIEYKFYKGYPATREQPEELAEIETIKLELINVNTYIPNTSYSGEWYSFETIQEKKLLDILGDEINEQLEVACFEDYEVRHPEYDYCEEDL